MLCLYRFFHILVLAVDIVAIIYYVCRTLAMVHRWCNVTLSSYASVVDRQLQAIARAKDTFYGLLSMTRSPLALVSLLASGPVAPCFQLRSASLTSWPNVDRSGVTTLL